MVNGIEKFKESFKNFKGQYALIGGVACGLLMDEYGLDFRATQDFDIVLIIEAMSKDFGKAIWDFIKNGGYKIRQKSNGEPEFYRFKEPTDYLYPKEIELFSRKSNVLSYDENDRLTPIHISNEISSLSAILLNDEYYSFLRNGLVEIDGIQTLNYTHIIPFKAKAWLDLKQRRANGEKIDSKNVTKHKNDVFRLSQLISEDALIEINEQVQNNMKLFIEKMSEEAIVLKDIGVRGKKEEILELLEKIYIQNAKVLLPS